MTTKEAIKILMNRFKRKYLHIHSPSKTLIDAVNSVDMKAEFERGMKENEVKINVKM